ncbi:MAG: hypothetical protein IJK24_07130 [Oscillospiraceae bacterium]|nr:hypothetical protein [Oscillospiraceae bacterium]
MQRKTVSRCLREPSDLVLFSRVEQEIAASDYQSKQQRKQPQGNREVKTRCRHGSKERQEQQKHPNRIRRKTEPGRKAEQQYAENHKRSAGAISRAKAKNGAGQKAEGQKQSVEQLRRGGNRKFLIEVSLLCFTVQKKPIQQYQKSIFERGEAKRGPKHNGCPGEQQAAPKQLFRGD